jgi:hypothetical protein
VVLAMALAACVPDAAPTAIPTETPEPAGISPMQVHHVEVQIGVGSPIPVDAFVSAELPDTCAQLAEVRQQLDFSSFTFEITLSVTPGTSEECFRDILPFRMIVPLNMVSLPDGTYTVDVNGVSTTFTWPSAPTVTPVPISSIYRNTLVGFDLVYPAGWLLDEAGDTDILWSQRPTGPGTEGVPGDVVKIDISSEPDTTMTLEELVARQKQGVTTDQILSEEELELPGGLRAVRMQVSALGDSVTLMTVVNGHPVVLTGFGDLSRFDEVARTLQPSQ